MKKNKKGTMITLELMQWLYKIAFLAVVIFVVVFLVRMYISTDISVAETELNLITYRILYSESGLSYYDDLTNRLHPGLIDERYLGEIGTTMNKSIFYGIENKHVAAEFKLYDTSEKQIWSYRYNSPNWKRWKVIANLKWPGAGGVDDSGTRQFLVNYRKENGETIPALLEMRILIPRS